MPTGVSLNNQVLISREIQQGHIPRYRYRKAAMKATIPLYKIINCVTILYKIMRYNLIVDNKLIDWLINDCSCIHIKKRHFLAGWTVFNNKDRSQRSAVSWTSLLLPYSTVLCTFPAHNLKFTCVSHHISQSGHSLRIYWRCELRDRASCRLISMYLHAAVDTVWLWSLPWSQWIHSWLPSVSLQL